MLFDILILNTETNKPERKAITAIAVFPFVFPSGHVELFAITDAQGVSSKPYVVTHVATGYKCGDPISVPTIATGKERLTRLMDRVKESGFMSAIVKGSIINTVSDIDLL
jgi:predicted solute-binding protein